MTKLSPVTRKFVLHWGEMGTRWGINRTVAQLHALLYISDQPLTAEKIAAPGHVTRPSWLRLLPDALPWPIARVSIDNFVGRPTSAFTSKEPAMSSQPR